MAPVGQDAPESPQALWEAQELENYRYTLQVSCFCLTDVTRPVVIEVRDGAVAGITHAEETGVPLSVDIDISEQMADKQLTLTVSDFEALR